MVSEFYALLAAQRVCVRAIMARRKIKHLEAATTRNATNELLKPVKKTTKTALNFVYIRKTPCYEVSNVEYMRVIGP